MTNVLDSLESNLFETSAAIEGFREMSHAKRVFILGRRDLSSMLRTPLPAITLPNHDKGDRMPCIGQEELG
ncbi:hypothetical protein EKH80_23470 [Dyella choica]|uniref:Uncharacterized protein n=1 Tax=Dyella choica TaxID=1927959 RepID=A0A432LYD4_9GAMM|nr:hypothetical protein EKH80_23470 [Dyella choica]